MSRLKAILLSSLLFLLLLEIAMRIFGPGTYKIQTYSLQSEPSYFLGADSGGFFLVPGKFTVTLNKEVIFFCNHLAAQERWSGSPKPNVTKQVGLLGCSFAYGFGLSDSQTFAFQLNQEFPQTQFYNHGVPGTSVAQSIRLIKKQRKDSTLKDLYIFAYASFQDERNVLNPHYRAALYHGFRNSSKHAQYLFRNAQIPYVKWDDDSPRLYWEKAHLQTLYRNWPGREYSATVNWLQSRKENKQVKKGKKDLANLILFERLNDILSNEGKELWVLLLSHDTQTDLFKKGLENFDIPAFYPLADYKEEGFNQLPHDSHPNAHANRSYADAIATQLRKASHAP